MHPETSWEWPQARKSRRRTTATCPMDRRRKRLARSWVRDAFFRGSRTASGSALIFRAAPVVVFSSGAAHVRVVVAAAKKVSRSAFRKITGPLRRETCLAQIRISPRDRRLFESKTHRWFRDDLNVKPRASTCRKAHHSARRSNEMECARVPRGRRLGGVRSGTIPGWITSYDERGYPASYPGPKASCTLQGVAGLRRVSTLVTKLVTKLVPETNFFALGCRLGSP